MKRIATITLIFLVGMAGCADTDIPGDVATDIAGDAPADIAEDAASDIPGDATTEIADDALVPSMDDLRINQIQIIATHNSYHISSLTDGEANELNYTHPPILEQLRDYGVRQLELDVWETEESLFNCYHLIFLDMQTHCNDIRDCLTVAREWSDANPTHVPLILVIEIKQAFGVDFDDVDGIIESGFYDRLETMFKETLGESRIITPDSVRGEFPTLRQALVERGWPTIGETRGKFMLILNTTSDRAGLKDAYIKKYQGLHGALMFAKDGQEDGYGAVVELNRVTRDAAEITTSLAEKYLIRSAGDAIGWDDGTIAELSAATPGSGVHWINTDFLIPQPGRGDYVFEWPGVFPVRCNPVTAPSDCIDALLEPGIPAL